MSHKPIRDTKPESRSWKAAWSIEVVESWSQSSRRETIQCSVHEWKCLTMLSGGASSFGFWVDIDERTRKLCRKDSRGCKENPKDDRYENGYEYNKWRLELKQHDYARNVTIVAPSITCNSCRILGHLCSGYSGSLWGDCLSRRA